MKDGINISTELATTGLPKSAIEIELEKLSAKVANLTAQVESLNAIRAVVKEDGEEEFEKPVKMVTLSKNETKSLGEPVKETYTTQEIGEKFDRVRREIMGEEGKKNTLVLHDTVKQEAEDLAQSHEKMLTALSQIEPNKMDYHMIKEMVKYIDILHGVRCSAERVASILTKN